MRIIHQLMFMCLVALLCALGGTVYFSAESDEILESYLSTGSFATSSASYLQYMDMFQQAILVDVDATYSRTTGEEIATFATALAEVYGNGGSAYQADPDTRKESIFYYTTADISDYSTATVLRNTLRSSSMQIHTIGISCDAFSTFCWASILDDTSVYGYSCDATYAFFKNIAIPVPDNGSTAAERIVAREEYIVANAAPGDLLLYYDNSMADFTHTEIYVGTYSSTDATGADYSFEHACVSANETGVNRDACIKPLEYTLATDRGVVLVRLCDYLLGSPIDISAVEALAFLQG